MIRLDLTGQQFGQLRVIERASNLKTSTRWKCVCVCGNEKIIRTTSLRHKNKNSCGCLSSAHGYSRTAIYRVWKGMRERCFNRNSPKYPDYGGRGIQIAARWNSFTNFLADVGDRPSPQHSLDRYPNKNGNYEPGNVRWATHKQQAENRRPRVKQRHMLILRAEFTPSAADILSFGG